MPARANSINVHRKKIAALKDTQPIDEVLRCTRLSGGSSWYRVTASPIMANDDDAVAGVVTTFADISALKVQQDRLEEFAHFDPLTHLPNRRLLVDRLNQALAQASRNSEMLAVCYLDLDGFKQVNDTHGHEQGDHLLVEVSRRLKSSLRAGDTVARLGGDEFALILTKLSGLQETEQALTRILHSVSRPISLDAVHSARVTGSIGVAICPTDSSDGTELLRSADAAMFIAKRSGKSRYQLFDAELERQADEQRRLLEELATAVREDEMVLWFQPKVDLANGQILGAEALIRWQHPRRGLLAPGEFLPQIQKSDLVVQVGDWVINAALRQAGLWQEDGLEMPISVNIAARQLRQASFFSKLKEALERHPSLPPRRLQLELVEASSLDDIDTIRAVMDQCGTLGVRFAIDDFGTGYSSLNYFRHLPADTLKIDGSFVDAMLDNSDDYLLVRGIVAIAQAFSREVVAEGVSSAAHGAKLLSLGCRVVQGYGVARPMPADEFAAWCASFRLDPRWRDAGAMPMQALSA